MKIPIKKGIKAGGGFLRLARLGLFGFFLLYLFISIILTAISERDINIVIKELGEEFYNPLQTAQEFSFELQQDQEATFLGSIWEYWGFYFNIYKIYLWFWILLIPVNFIFKESNAPIIRFGVVLIIFYGIQVLFSVLYLKQSPEMPFIATKDILQGLVHIFTNFDFSSGKESLIRTTNECNESICTI